MKFLAVFRSNFSDGITDWLKVFINASKTSFRLAKLQQSENKSSYFEIDQNGDIRLRRQLDTREFKESQLYSEVVINQSGEVNITVNGKSITSIEINDSGVKLSTTSSMDLSSEEDIKISSSSLKINSDDIDFIGDMKLNGKKVAVKGDSTSDGATIS